MMRSSLGLLGFLTLVLSLFATKSWAQTSCPTQQPPCSDGCGVTYPESICKPCGKGKHGTPSGECLYCEAGLYTDKTMTEHCFGCDEGSYCLGPAGNGSKTPCPKGRYGIRSVAKTLEQGCPYWCPPGFYGNVTGAYSEETACGISCPVGFYCPGKNKVLECPPGRFGAFAGQTSMESGCFVCNAGYYCPRGAAHNPCPAGKFGNTTGQSNELLACPGQCPGGWFPNPNGAFGGHQFVYSACIPCPPGWRVKFPPQPGSMSISQACEQCPEGQFSSNYGSQSCTACPLGRFANTNTSSSDGGKGRLMLPSCTLECPAGKHGKSMGQTVEHLSCVPCEKGRYSASQGQGAVCAGLCPSGKYGNFTGTTSADEACPNPCPKGEWCPGGSVRNVCPAGKYGPNTEQTNEHDACLQCTAGHYCDGKTVSIASPCPLGKWGNVQGAKTEGEGCPFSCPQGTTPTQQGANSQALACTTGCPPGKHANADGSSGCIKCKKGQYMPTAPGKHKVQCMKCPIGKFQDKLGQKDCALCPQGTHGTEAGQPSQTLACEACAAGRYSGDTTAVKKCEHTCPPGKYGKVIGKDSEKSACSIPCPVGFYCPGKNKVLKCPTGRFGYETGQTSEDAGCFTCNAGYFCPNQTIHRPCPAGKFGNTTGQSNELLACPGQCPGGWFPNPNGAFGGHQFVYSACIPCPPGWRVKFPPQPGSMSISQACEQCPEGQFSSNYGSQSCTACPLGRFANTNTSSSDGGKGRLMLPSCTLECPAGKHGQSRGQTTEELACVACEASRYSNVAGITSPLCPGECAPGKYGNVTGETLELNACQDCARGQYSTEGGKAKCQKCEKGKYGDSPGKKQDKTACISCQSGKFNDLEGQTICKPCPTGRNGLLPGQTNAVKGCDVAGPDCPRGYYCKGGRETPCPAGKWGNTVGQTNESLACPNTCASGRYGDVTRRAKTTLNDACPKSCPQGYHGTGGDYTTKQLMSKACVKCAPGSYNGETGQRKCAHLCKPGKYGNVPQALDENTACPFKCPAGRYGDEAGKTSQAAACPHVCPIGHWCPEGTGATEMEKFVCPAGRYGIGTNQTSEELACRDCNAGYFCPGKKDRFACPAGRFGSSSKRYSQQTACPGRCPIGKYGDEVGHQVEYSACKECIPGMYGSSDAKGPPTNLGQGCRACESGLYSTEFGETGACSLNCPPGTLGLEQRQAKCIDRGQPGPNCPNNQAKGCPEKCVPGTYGTEWGQKYVGIGPQPGCKLCAKGMYEPRSGQQKCSRACPKGKYGNQTGAPSEEVGCGGKCPRGKHGVNVGKDSVSAACSSCEAGKYNSEEGQEVCQHCPPGKFNKHRNIGEECVGGDCCQACPGYLDQGACTNHGVCQVTTGKCECRTDLGYQPPDCSICQPGWDNSDGSCSKCDVGFTSSHVGHRKYCLQICAGGFSTERDEKGNCPMPIVDIIKNICLYLLAIGLFSALLYKVIVFFLLLNSGKIKEEYKNMNGFCLFFAYGKNGNHMVGYVGKTVKRRERDSEEERERPGRHRNSFVELSAGSSKPSSKPALQRSESAHEQDRPIMVPPPGVARHNSLPEKRNEHRTFNDVLEQLKFEKYKDGLNQIGCDSIEVAAMCDLEDLLGDEVGMKRMHAKMLIKTCIAIFKRRKKYKR